MFAAITGHRRLLSRVSRAIAHGTLPPALLFAGPSGVGKRRAALALAAAVNCLQPRSTTELEHDACGDCISCRRIARGVHPDVLVLAPGDSGSIKVDAVREVIVGAGYRPFEGRRRVVVVDDAEALVVAAQSALLKTLEEPPSASIFVLVSAMPDALLPTVLSRCPRLRFAPLSAAEVADLLVRDHGYSAPDAQAAAADADGSIGRALAAESSTVGAAREQARRLLEHTARGADPVRLLEAVKDTPGERDQVATSLRALGSLLRDLSLLATGGDPRAIVNADLEAQLAPLAKAFDRRRITRAYAAVHAALDALQRNVSPKVVMDWLVLRI